MLCIFWWSNAIRACTKFLRNGDPDCQLVRLFFAVVHNFFCYQTCQVAVRLTTGFGTGMIGALTTFSTFSFETVAFLQQGAVLIGAAYWLVNLCGGLLFAALGCMLGGKL